MQEARKFQLFFVFFFVFFVLVFSYLLFFNTGLELRIKASGEEINIVVLNNSIHTIKDIKVEQFVGGKKLLVAEIAMLRPKETKILKPKELVDSVIVVNAPFHAKITKELRVKGIKSGNFMINLKLKAAEYAFLDVNYAVKLQLCNQSKQSARVVIVTDFSEHFFPHSDREELVINAKECREYSKVLIPMKKGTARIVFNLNVDNYSRRIEKIVNVEA